MAEEKKTLPAKQGDGRMQRWDPWKRLEEMRGEMARLWDEPFPFRFFPLRLPETQTTAHAPRMDVYEKNGALMLQAELPGLTKDDVEITFDDGDLVIRGEKKAAEEVKEQDYYRMERTYGSFYRRLALPFEVTPEQITATVKDGVLEVRIPKPAEKKPEAKKITVKGG
jgi:HSP20 family protein